MALFVQLVWWMVLILFTMYWTTCEERVSYYGTKVTDLWELLGSHRRTFPAIRRGRALSGRVRAMHGAVHRFFVLIN